MDRIKAKEAFREAFRVVGNDSSIAKISFYQGMAILAEDVERVITLLTSIKDATERTSRHTE